MLFDGDCFGRALKTRHANHLSWPVIFEFSAMRPALPYNIVCKNAFK